MTIWQLLQKFTAFVEIGTLSEIHRCTLAEIGLKVVFFRLYLVHGTYLIFAIKKMMFSVYGKNAIIALAYMFKYL